MTKQTYKKLDSISHIHARPDMYIGTNKTRSTEHEFLWNGECMEYHHELNFNEGFVRIFLEALSNAVDNFYRSQTGGTPMTKLVVKLNNETGQTSIWNDGNFIPVEMHEEEQIYIPELIFGHLLSGSNYDDTDERITSGRNGLGVKLLNVFSSEFQVECYDPQRQLLYKQKWKQNMKKVYPASITEKTAKSGYTKISWKPDFSKFGMESYDDIHLKIYQKYVIDASMIMKIPVYWNEQKFNLKNFGQYVQLYSNETVHMVQGKTDVMEYCICPSFCGASQVSFVNGMITKDGGLHVEKFTGELFRQLTAKLSKLKVSSKDLKPYFNLFLNVTLANPEFSSQSKTKLVGSRTPFQVEIPSKVIQQILKWDFVQDITELYKMKEMLQLKKSEKKRGFRKIEGFDAANFAGGKHAKDCILILCEGLSAKTYSVQGISKGFDQRKGRNFFGVYPLRGKPLNVRRATLKSVSENKEITDIIHCLNLRFDADYTTAKDFESLSYGQVCIITDADDDGHHICSLLLNLFHKLFPSLLKRSPPFFSIMMTPIAKIKSRDGVQTFYNDYQYQECLTALQEQNKKFDVKYYKGLGTSSNQEIKESFGEKLVYFVTDETTDVHLNMIFQKQQSENRKTWLLSGNPSQYEVPDTSYPITLYLNQELMKYSLEDCKRSIPSVFDGLKVSQRKILYSVFKKNLSPTGKSLKVAQLAGYCAEHSNYHHGEQCLYETIIKMCHEFPGSNNIPYFEKDGQFGSRVYGGKDAANARYIFTKLTPLTRLLFPPEDDCLLSYTFDDGMKVEPDAYIPILPMILVNGCTAGIGTGWSCSIPSYNPLELIEIIKKFLKNEENTASFELCPFYRGFTGRVRPLGNGKFETLGTFQEKVGDRKRKVTITELPIGTWTDKYKEELENFQEQKKIKSFRNYSSTEQVHFEFESGTVPMKFEQDTLKLRTFVHVTNMVLFDEHRIQKFESIRDIFECYFKARLDLYCRRKEHLLSQLSLDLSILENKQRFIMYILEKKIDMQSLQEQDLIQFLKDEAFLLVENSFDYLLRITIRDFTTTKVEQLQKSIHTMEQTVASIRASTPQKLWLQDLAKLEQAYHRIYK